MEKIMIDKTKSTLGLGSYISLFLLPRRMAAPPDRLLAAASDRLGSKATETVHTLANEPSLGIYYVMEHIQRSVPELVACKQQTVWCKQQLQGASLDAACARESIGAMLSEETMRGLAHAEASALRALAAAKHQQKMAAERAAERAIARNAEHARTRVRMRGDNW